MPINRKWLALRKEELAKEPHRIELAKRLAILKQNFTQKDLAFVRGKIILPLVGAPWLRPFKGCKQTKRAIVGDIIIRIRANRLNLDKDRQYTFHADWAPINAPHNFRDYVNYFNEKFENKYSTAN
jgi:hypothetical protein